MEFDELMVFPETTPAERVNEAAGGKLLNGKHYQSSAQLFLFRSGGDAVLASMVSSDVFAHEVQNATFGPEVRIVAAEVDPELVPDLHGQLSYVDDEGAPITASIAWPVIAPENLTPERGAAVAYAKQVSALMATSDTTVIASSPGSATLSERLAAQVLDRDDALNLLVAGADRGANRADGDTYERATPTTASESALRRAALEAVDRGEVSLQVLGATRDGREVALTSGTVPPTEHARGVDRGLEAAGYPTCLYADGTCEDQSSTGNLLVKDARAAAAEPLVLYPSYGIRGTFAEREEPAVTPAELA